MKIDIMIEEQKTLIKQQQERYNNEDNLIKRIELLMTINELVKTLIKLLDI